MKMSLSSSAARVVEGAATATEDSVTYGAAADAATISRSTIMRAKRAGEANTAGPTDLLDGP